MRRTALKQKTPLRAKKDWASSYRAKAQKSLTKGKFGLSRGKSKPKPNRIKTLKRKLWETFSKYIRLSWANDQGMLLTCDGVYTHWKNCDCGHLFANSERSQSLGGNKLWYEEDNFAPQSNSGNRFNQGDSAKRYMKWAIERYGMDRVNEMEKLKQIPCKFTEEELTQRLEYYKIMVEELENA